MKSIIILLLLISSSVASRADETNKLFLTDDGFLRINRAKKVEEAKKSRESLPAEQFTEGNWGATTNGIQLSLRLEKASFTVGEPITAIMLLRNTTNNVQKYRVASVFGSDGPIDFIVADSNGALKPISVEPKDIISSRQLALAPTTQHKYEERLDSRFNLKTPGFYTVSARFAIADRGVFEVQSSNIRIEIR
jgi:hypothetical protein